MNYSENDTIGKFFLFVRCRHMIWRRRFVEKSPPPWTDDPILAKYKFTNVYRELDRGTQYLWKSLDHVPKNLVALLFPVVVYRFVNNPKFFEWLECDYDISVETFRRACHKYLEDTGGPLFSSAYRVVCNTPGGGSRIDEMCKALAEMEENYEEIIFALRQVKTYEQFNQELQRIKHVGALLAYEMATDLVNICPEVRKKFSENDWANIGPGAFVGLANIYPSLRRKLEKEPQDLGLKLARELQSLQTKYLPFKFPYYHDKKLSLRNIEHSLCEYGKYCNIQNGKGRPRPLFHNSP